MPPPLQFPTDRVGPRPGESSVPAVKKAPPPSSIYGAAAAAAAASAKIARPASAPDLAALSATRPRPAPDRKLARPTPLPQQQHRGGLAPHGASRPRPPSTPAKNGAPSNPSLRRQSAPAARDGSHGKAAAAASLVAPRGQQTVRPARRLAPGTAVYVRTAFSPRNIKCRILLWLPARVVSAFDAYNLTVKYAADLNDMFAGKIVRKPVDQVRVAPHRAAARPEPRKMEPPAPENKATSLSRQ